MQSYTYICMYVSMTPNEKINNKCITANVENHLKLNPLLNAVNHRNM